MSRRIVSYRDGRAVWEDLGPVPEAEWGMALGGRRIEEAPSAADRLRVQQAAYAARKRAQRAAR